MQTKYLNNILGDALNNIFIEGQFNVGKTTLILEICKELNIKCAGFVSIKLFDEENSIKAYYLQKFHSAIKTNLDCKDDSIDNKRVYLSFQEDKSIINLKAFDQIDDVFSKIDDIDCFIMDEIGGFELASQEFRNMMFSLLESGIMCIGTVKSDDNFDRMRNKLKEECPNIEQSRRTLLQKLEVLTLTRQNREQIKEIIINRINKRK